MATLGKLEPVDIKKQWPLEDRDFTPWLAKEGLPYLNDAGIVNDQLLGGERALTQQYAGRVPFDLLQNALDRCDKHVLVAFQGDHLVVANDGIPVSFDPEFNHEIPLTPGQRLSDFHALCSMHTSSKSADENFGKTGRR